MNPADIGSLAAQYGIPGVVLAWFMFRVEKKLDNHTSVINDLALSITLDVVSRENISPSVKSRGDELLERLTQRKVTMAQ